MSDATNQTNTNLPATKVEIISPELVEQTKTVHTGDRISAAQSGIETKRISVVSGEATASLFVWGAEKAPPKPNAAGPSQAISPPLGGPLREDQRRAVKLVPAVV